VHVAVDEARCYDETGGVDRFLAADCLVGGRSNRRFVDADVADFVNVGLRVYRPTAGDAQVVFFGCHQQFLPC
jgi:hypothetical protein